MKLKFCSGKRGKVLAYLCSLSLRQSLVENKNTNAATGPFHELEQTFIDPHLLTHVCVLVRTNDVQFMCINACPALRADENAR